MQFHRPFIQLQFERQFPSPAFHFYDSRNIDAALRARISNEQYVSSSLKNFARNRLQPEGNSSSGKPFEGGSSGSKRGSKFSGGGNIHVYIRTYITCLCTRKGRRRGTGSIRWRTIARSLDNKKRSRRMEESLRNRLQSRWDDTGGDGGGGGVGVRGRARSSCRKIDPFRGRSWHYHTRSTPDNLLSVIYHGGPWLEIFFAFLSRANAVSYSIVQSPSCALCTTLCLASEFENTIFRSRQALHVCSATYTGEYSCAFARVVF